MRTKPLKEFFGLGIALLIGLLPALSSTSRAGTLTVGLDGGADFATIQWAIEEAGDGDTIVVQAGEYVIDAPITFPAPMTLTLKAESGPEATTIRMSDTPADRRLASVFLFDKRETDKLVVEGFTITGGNGITRGGFQDRGGGGVMCLNGSSPRLIDCHISGNSLTTVAVGGGGVYCQRGSSPTFERCRITNNQADWAGGIFCNDRSSPTFLDCLIAGNSARQGGGIAIRDESAPTFVNCQIVGNSATDATASGGGVFSVVNERVTPRFQNCVFAGNSARGAGGGLLTNASGALLEDCVFVGNTANEGAAVDCTWFPSPTLVRCTITDNAANSGPGGVMANLRANPSLTSCIVWGNRGGPFARSTARTRMSPTPAWREAGAAEATSTRIPSSVGQRVTSPSAASLSSRSP